MAQLLSRAQRMRVLVELYILVCSDKSQFSSDREDLALGSKPLSR